MKKKAVFAAGLAAALSLGCAGTYAYYSSSVTVTNHIATGDINIDLTEYEEDQEGNLIAYVDHKVVQPSEEIVKIPRITNLSMPCWVRAKISYTADKAAAEQGTIAESDVEASEVTEEGEEDQEFILSDLAISGMPEEWVKKGDYYYLTVPLKEKESVDLFRKVTIPAEWTEAVSDSELGIQIEADAIQSANFTPDFAADAPWGNEEIEICVHESDNEITSVEKQYQDMSVEFNGAAYKLLAVPDDFFSNFTTTMPGDVISDAIVLSNTTHREAEFFFSTSLPDELNDDQKALLKEYKLTIRLGNKVLYEGDLEAASLNREISLGSYQPGAKEKFQFEVTLPATEKNAVAKRNTAVNWTFTVHQEEENISQNMAPKTGLTDTNWMLPLALAILSGEIVFTVCVKGGKRNEEEK